MTYLDTHVAVWLFDRLIVTQAVANDAPLVTKDDSIRRHYRRAVW